MTKSENRGFLYILIFGVCCGPISTGYILGYSSPTLRDLSSVLSTVAKSTFASLLYIGGIIGSLIVAHVMERYGRRKSILYSALPAILGWLLIIFGNLFITNMRYYVYLLYLSRLLGGISCGMNMACTTVYLVEISPTTWRGTIASLNQVGITVGIFLSYLFGNYFAFDQSAILALCFSIALYIVCFYIPESPRWLVTKDMLLEAENSLKKLRPVGYDAEQELNELTSQSSYDSTKSPIPSISPIQYVFPIKSVSLMAMFHTKYRQKTLIVIQLMLLQQFSGINAFISYCGVIFLSVIHVSRLFEFVPIIIGFVQIVFTVLATVLMDRYGRKSFLKFAGFLMAVAMTSLSFGLKEEIEILTMLSMALYIIGFSIGWGPIPVISSTEMFPQEARSSASSIAVMTSWIGGYLVTSSFPFLVISLGHPLVFLIFATMCAYSIYFVNKNLPETKGLSLEDVIV